MTSATLYWRLTAVELVEVFELGRVVVVFVVGRIVAVLVVGRLALTFYLSTFMTAHGAQKFHGRLF